MTQQAINSLELYKGNDPDKILQLLAYQKQSVVDELKAYHNAVDMRDLAIKLSLGR